jgi:hypothetical protein
LSSTVPNESLGQIIRKLFYEKLEVIFGKLLERYLIVDVQDIFNINKEPEDFYEEQKEKRDETIDIRVYN